MENQDKNTPKARIFKNVANQKNQLQIKDCFVGGFVRCANFFGSC